MLDKEKERLLKEDERQCRLVETNKRRLEDIGREISKLQGVETTVKSSGTPSFSERAYTQRSGVKKEWKKMVLNY